MEHVLREPPAGWQGASGIVTDEVLRRALPVEPSSAVYFLCGPRPMNDAAQAALHRLGVPLHRIHFELFDMA